MSSITHTMSVQFCNYSSHYAINIYIKGLHKNILQHIDHPIYSNYASPTAMSVSTVNIKVNVPSKQEGNLSIFLTPRNAFPEIIIEAYVPGTKGVITEKYVINPRDFYRALDENTSFPRLYLVMDAGNAFFEKTRYFSVSMSESIRVLGLTLGETERSFGAFFRQ